MAPGDVLSADTDVERAPLEELACEHFEHLDAHHGAGATEAIPDQEPRATATCGSIPYALLNEHAFERLCFHILLAQERNPRFWGRRGQKQHGIDLIFSDGGASTVYQCKHYAAFGAADLKKALDTFQRDWLEARPELGQPSTFVLCTSADLKDTTEWEERKRKFHADTGVLVEEWHRDMLDTWLRDQPGIVADLFGDRMAELFCSRGRDWDLGLFRPLVRGADKRRVDRYLDLRDAGRIIRHPGDECEFTRILGLQDVVLLGGLAGAGKTMAALDLASAFDGGSWRVFFLRPTATHDVDRLFAGIRDRAFRPSIFILDDCHLAFDRVEALVERLTARRDPRIKLVLTARTPPESMDFLDPIGIEFVNLLRDDGQVIEIVADETRYQAIVGVRKHEWDNPPIDRLLAWTGRDLAILDLILDAIEPSDLKDVGELEDLFPRMLRQFFNGAKAAHAPNLKQLAAIVQFDVTVPVDAFPDPLEPSRNAMAVGRFVFVGAQPAALAFHHPSAAELVFRLLAWAHGEQDPSNVAARDCAAVMTRCADLYGPDYALNDLLPRLLRTRLKLTNDEATKLALLTDERVLAMVDDASAHISVVTLNIAAFLCRDLENPSQYAVRLAERIERWAHDPTEVEGIGLMGIFLRTLRMVDPNLHLTLERRVRPSRMKDLVAARGTLFELLRILEQSTNAFAADLLRSFDGQELAALVQDIDAKKSIGALGVRLRELRQRRLSDDPDRTLLDLFEQRLDPSRMKDLVARRGTLVELLRILQNSNDAFAADLLRSFEAHEVATLVERIDTKKSIGTLSLGLRELRQRRLPDDPDRTQLDLFEERLDPARIKALVYARGTLVELLNILQHSTDTFAAALLRSFDARELATLVERTIAEQESLGNVNQALRTLGRRELIDSSYSTQLDLFEKRLGADGFWRVVQGAGNLNHLAYLLGGLSPTFRATVVAPDYAPDLQGWVGLARRGTLYDPARFALDNLALLPDETAERFRVAVEATAADLAARSTWGEIGSSLAKTEEIVDERVRTTLRAATEQRIGAVDIARLRLDDYEAATGCMSVLWRHREELRPEIGALLWQLLPDELNWPSTHRLLLQARFVLAVARSEHVSDGDAVRVLRAFAPLGLDVAIDPKSARYHALFLWNLFALWFQRGHRVAQEFRGLQHEKTWDRFVEVVEKRQTWRRNEDKLDTLVLAGALAFLVPDLRARLTALVRGNVTGIQHLSGVADETLTFVPALLTFHGMALSAPEHAIFTPDRVRRLLDKAKDYDERGPAITRVCEGLRFKLKARASRWTGQTWPPNGEDRRR